MLNREEEMSSTEEVDTSDMFNAGEGYIEDTAEGSESKEHDYESMIEKCSSKEDLQNIISMAQNKLKEIE